VTLGIGFGALVFSSRHDQKSTTAVLLMTPAELAHEQPSNLLRGRKRPFEWSNLLSQSTRELAIPAEAPIREPQMQDEFEGDVEQRRQWFISQRMFPFDELPPEARRKAWDSRLEEKASINALEVLQWQPIGPQPTTSYFPSNWGKTSGRINSIAVSPTDPNLVLVGAATGGIWRSTDGGTNFVPVSDSQVDLAVGSIAFAPTNSSIVYAGMGDKDGGYLGTGVLRSTDAGVTWSRVSNSTLPAYGLISQVLVDATDANRVYVAQYAFSQANNIFSSGFFYSTNGGVNWTKTIGGTARDLVCHPTQSSTLYLAEGSADAANGSSGGIFKSTNSGQSWTRIYTSPFGTADNIKVAVTPAAPQNLYVLVGKTTARVEVSTNGGSSWTNLGANFDVGQFFYNCYLFVHPTDTNTIFVGTRDLWRSTNGGSTYTNITNNFSISGNYTPNSAKAHPDQHHFHISTSSPNTIYIANDGGLWKSTDGASSFASLNNSLSLTMFTSYDLHPTDASRSYGGTQDNGTQKRTGGQTWREFAAGDGGQTFADTLDPSIVYATYIQHTMFRFSNNGDSLSATIGSPATFNNDRVDFYPPFVGNDTNSNLYFGTYRLYVSTNRGSSWTAPGGSTDLTFGRFLSAIAVAKSNTNVIYTGSSDGRVMVSSSGGSGWTDRTAGLPQRFIKSITVTPTDPNTAYVTVSGFASGHVFKTTNAGASWSDISGNLPDVPANTLLIDPRAGNSNTLYVGTDVGVFRSTVGGGAWQSFNTGMPPTIISELDAQASGVMQAGTYGRGAYEINLNDTTGSTVQFSSANYSVNENGGTATITVTRSGSTATTSSVNYATSNGTALSGQDYTAASGPISFGVGETSKTFNVTIADDGAVEGNETINLTLSSASGATLGSPSSAVLTINDNDQNCSYVLSPTSQSFPTAGGNGSFTVTTAAGCAWSAVSNASWLTTTSSGTGSGTVNYSVASNSGSARSGAITVNGQTFTVNQSGSGGGCASTSIAYGQSITGTLTTSDCIFTGTTRYVDVYNFSGTSGQQIAISMSSTPFDTYLYLLNSSNQLLAEDDDGLGGTNSRIPTTSGFFTLPASGTYTIYATSFSDGSTGSYTISLSSASCNYALNPTSQSFGSGGGSSSFNVTTAAGCAWAAVSNSSWLITSSTGSGNGTVSFSVSSNSGSSRSGTITVNGQVFTVNQSSGGGCPATSIAVGQTINGSLAAGDCIFTGTSRNVDVYSFTGSSGQQVAIVMSSANFDTYLYLLDSANQLITQDDDGGGSTNSRIPATSGFLTLPASGTYTIYAASYSSDGVTGQTGSYSISLAGPSSCSYTLSPTSESYGASGGNGSFNVTAGAGCSWTANSNSGWLTTNSSGSGNGTVTYIVASNTGSSRTGTITIGNQTFTVTQNGGGGGCPATGLSVGQTMTATLTTSDCIFTGTTRYVDVYNFSGVSGQQIAVNMNSSTFDTYLYLLDANDQLIMQDDDGGGNTNSRIPTTSGFYTLPNSGSFTIYATSYSANGLSGSTGGYSISLVTPSQGTMQFSLANYNVNEGSNSVLVTLTRSGDTSSAASVDYVTTDNTASQSRDYTLGAGRVSFAVGETSKSFTILVSDDLLVETSEMITISLTNASGGSVLGNPGAATITVIDNDSSSPTTNPLDNADARFFVRQHYSDFLSRNPDSSGYDYWSGQISQCGSDAACRRIKYTDVSNAFFFEQEFQQTGSYVYRLYRAAFGNNQPFPNPNPDPAHPGEERKFPSYTPFMRDRAQVRGGSQLAQLQLDLANAFVARGEFTTKYPTNLTAAGFVDAVLAVMQTDIGVNMTSQRTALINLFNSSGRGAVMYRLADDNAVTNPINNRAFIDGEYNRAFVFTQYAGYLRRNADMAGLLFWLGQVNSAPLRDVGKQHAMVCAFITSAEYQQRFSSVVTRSNTECQ